MFFFIMQCNGVCQPSPEQTIGVCNEYCSCACECKIIPTLAVDDQDFFFLSFFVASLNYF